MNSIGTGTKSQQALQLQREQNKLIRQEKTKEQKEAEKRAAFALRQEKKKEKRRGLTLGAAVNGGINNGRGSE